MRHILNISTQACEWSWDQVGTKEENTDLLVAQYRRSHKLNTENSAADCFTVDLIIAELLIRLVVTERILDA